MFSSVLPRYVTLYLEVLNVLNTTQQSALIEMFKFVKLMSCCEAEYNNYQLIILHSWIKAQPSYSFLQIKSKDDVHF